MEIHEFSQKVTFHYAYSGSSNSKFELQGHGMVTYKNLQQRNLTLKNCYKVIFESTIPAATAR
jgi:hypothetical protein